MFALTAGQYQPLLQDSHGKERLGAALELHLTEVEIDRLHYRNMESGGGSSTCRSVVFVHEQPCDEKPTRSTWPNSPTARVQTIWKSLSLADERRSGSLSDLLTRITRGQPHIKGVHQMSLSTQILPRHSSLALGFLALLYFLSAAEHKATNDVLEGPEMKIILIFLDEPVDIWHLFYANFESIWPLPHKEKGGQIWWFVPLSIEWLCLLRQDSSCATKLANSTVKD